MAKTTPKVALIDNPHAPEVFADGCVGAFLLNGNAHITFAAQKCDYTKQSSQFVNVVIGRLVIPFGAAENMVQFLTEFLNRMKQQAAIGPDDEPRTLQ
jgi:hypothetical protein